VEPGGANGGERARKREQAGEAAGKRRDGKGSQDAALLGSFLWPQSKKREVSSKKNKSVKLPSEDGGFPPKRGGVCGNLVNCRYELGKKKKKKREDQRNSPNKKNENRSGGGNEGAKGGGRSTAFQGEDQPGV